MSIKSKYGDAVKELEAMIEMAESEERSFTEEENERYQALETEVKGLRAQMSLADQVKQYEVKMEHEKKETPQVKGTAADQVLQSENYKSWLDTIAPGGAVSSAKISTLPRIELKSHFKELITGAAVDSAGAFVIPDQSGIYESIGRYPTVLRNLISTRTTDSDTVEFVRQTVQVNEADVVPEANVKYPIGYPGEIDGTKPQGKMNFERVQVPVETVAVYVGATKRALADAGQLRGIIDQELRGNLTEEVERLVFETINNTAGVLTQAFNTDIMRTARQAITTLAVTGRQRPTAFVFHPSDWETVELQQDLAERYYWAGPANQGPARLWGVPVVESFFVTPGSAWLANWNKAVLWDRQQTTITATDSHEDWFIRNMVAILAELRAAFAVIRPSAFVEVELS
jgi:HK97 family phage major capsid protein